MRVVFTGQTGVRSKDAAVGTAEFALHAWGLEPSLENIRSLERIGVWSAEHFISANCGGSVWTYLDILDWRERRRIWREALREALDEIAQRPEATAFLVLHNYYYRRGHYRSEVQKSLDMIREFGPDALVTLIDDSYDVWKRIFDINAQDPSASYLRLSEVYSWRCLEVDATDSLAIALCTPSKLVPNYVVPVKHSAAMLHRLLFEPAVLSVYLSMPITEVRTSPQARQEVERVRGLLHSRFAVFDPITVDEKLLELILRRNYPDLDDTTEPPAELLEVHPDDRWPLWESLPPADRQEPMVRGELPLDIPAREVHEVAFPIRTEFVERKSIVDYHIALRDYRMVAQSDCLAVYRPCYRGRPSSGVLAEITFARACGLPIVTYHPEEDTALVDHPFHEYGSVYRGLDDWLDGIARVQERSRGRTRRPFRA